MRRNKLPLLFIFLIIFLFSNDYLYSQCGVIPGISNAQAGPNLQQNINAGTTVFDPGWVAYDWKWEINNTIVSTDSVLIPRGLTDGFSNVCLTVYATNSSTGDSCTRQVCNIFQSTGSNIFPQFEIDVNGLDVTVIGTILTGDTTWSFQTDIDWGDGSSSLNTTYATHTYAVAGDYMITFGSYGSATGLTTRKAQVDNGVTNINVSNFDNSGISGCYPLTVASFGSTPPFPDATASMYGHATFEPPFYIYNLTPIVYASLPQYPVVPGQAIVDVEITDPNFITVGDKIQRFAPVFFDACGVVPDTITGKVFHDQDADGIFDAGEPGLPNREISLRALSTATGNYHVLTDSAGNYSILAPNASFRISTGEPNISLTFPQSNTYMIDGAANNTFPQYNFGVADINTAISGNVYLDYNQDSVYNTSLGDVPFQFLTVKAENSINGLKYFESSSYNGSYSFNIPMGNYAITPNETNDLDSAVYYPDTIFVNSSGGNFTQKNIGFYSPVAGNFDIRLYSPGEARPGFDYGTTIVVKNTGFDTMSGTVIFSFDSILTASSVSPIGGVIDNVNHTVTWPTGLILPTRRNDFSVIYTIPVSTPLGTIMSFSGQVNADPGYTDNYLVNNSNSFQETVIGSFDPNDKKVDPQGIGGQGNVLHSDRLHYRIRFQNTGTASAINVIVQDEIDTQLDLNTFQMENVSHSYNLVTNGNTFTWKFLSIGLPDSNTNEPASHGFIEYSIRPIQGLADGTEIENTAAIYFDFNAPVITNTTLNTLQTTLVSVEEIPENTNLSLYPVPVQNEITIVSETGLNEEISIDLLDVNGRLVRNIHKGKGGVNRINANTSDLVSGTYIIRILSDNEVMRKLFVKQ